MYEIPPANVGEWFNRLPIWARLLLLPVLLPVMVVWSMIAFAGSSRHGSRGLVWMSYSRWMFFHKMRRQGASLPGTRWRSGSKLVKERCSMRLESTPVPGGSESLSLVPENPLPSYGAWSALDAKAQERLLLDALESGWSCVPRNTWLSIRHGRLGGGPVATVGTASPIASTGFQSSSPIMIDEPSNAPSFLVFPVRPESIIESPGEVILACEAIMKQPGHLH